MANNKNDQLYAIFSEFVINTMNGICVFDANDKIIFSNDSAAQMFGYKNPSSLQDLYFKDIITHCHHTQTGLAIQTDDLEGWLKIAYTKRRSKTHRRFETDLHNGSWYLISEHVVHDGCIVMISADITDKKNAENRLTEMSKELFFLATTDALTNVFNRRHFIEQAQIEQRRCRRENYGYALLMLDLDFFKSINDNHGHACGDCVLTTVAGAIQSQLREYDLLGRIGGEEFAILLPNTDSISALTIAERIRKAIEALQIECKAHTLNVTASTGVALDKSADKCLEDMFLVADQLLYQAKENGRNKVVICH